jgi:hypothetical protein
MVDDQEPQRPLFEFVGSEPAPSQEILESEPNTRRWHRPAIWGLAGVVALVVLLNLTGHHDPRVAPPDRFTASLPHPPPVSAPLCDGLGCDQANGPSRAIMFAFAKHVPGSIVVSERTVYGRVRGDLVMRRRLVNAVSGNVEMKVAIARAGVATHRLGRPARQIAHHGYVIDFSFVGFYPPPTPSLRALADDTRLISVQS